MKNIRPLIVVFFCFRLQGRKFINFVMLVRCQVPERPVFCFRSGAYVSHCCVFRFFATPIFGQRDAYFSHCLFSRDPWANVSNRAVLLVFVLVHAFLICCFFLANRGVLLALVCSLPSLQGGFAFFGFALVAPRGLLFVIPERTFRIAVFWCFSKMLLLARERQNAGLEM